ncbi:MAG: hypothetical protein EZS28_003491 [Streblomastix strix]|uniref:Uncharacterized protein n=1 Tax=Streblomastix strix TaxID=222440 RepID=A0A5J4X3C3_9EUKA|nr:MAG: hypothetical protein EZS28_003491 [Streblomastix strix]
MSNVVTTLGAATGGGNAITDISIDGNVLTPAKNKNFVDTDYDQKDDALLLFKADKTQLIDSYTKGETDNLLNNKANTGVSYTKGEDDTLLFANADKTQLIDSYTKGEDDALLLLKADKTQLIDSHTKGETDNLLNNKANTGVFYTKGEDDTLLFAKADKIQLIDSYSKSETYARDEVYTKSEDDTLPFAKADETQLIDSYTKGETDNLLNNKANNGASYTKGEDDTLLFAKADKTQLIDSYTKGETDNLLNNKADTGVSYSKSEYDALLLLKADKTQLIDSYTKGEADNLLNNKANQSTTYTKIETDQLISQIETGDVDLSSYYTKTKTDELLDEKANTTDLYNYMTLGTSQTITANKTFNNACRFISSIDGMSTVTGSSFVKLGVNDTVVLLGAGGTKPISEFAGAPTDLSNYYTKTQTFSQTEENNKFVRFDGSIQQTITGRLKYVSLFDYPDETQDPVANTYLTMSDVDAKLTNVVTTNTTQSVTGAKTFNATVTATGFAKTGKDDTSVLLAGGGDRLLSSFGGIEDLTSSAFSGMNSAVIQYGLIRIGNQYIFSLLANGGSYNAGTFNLDYLVKDNDAVATYISFPNHTVDNGGYIIITHSIGLKACKSITYTYIQCASVTWVK